MFVRRINRIFRRQEKDLSKNMIEFGSFRSLQPIIHSLCLNGNLCIDRYYINEFISQHNNDIRGHVLEIGDDTYTSWLGGNNVTKSDVLHFEDGNPKATIVADLTRIESLPLNTFNCVICTQTLQYIYDVRRAIRTLHYILRPCGVVLATFPTIAHISRYDLEHWGEYWRFTGMGARRLFEEDFSPDDVEIKSYGNVLTAMAFLHGIPADQLSQTELDHCDQDYEVLTAVRAVKGESSWPITQ
ncbi:MAG: methyltransferase domain-containing protein [Chloroflexota bacterium]|nr:methyltransferase domain-containing protein [Chloroflexota bacterium]